MKETDFVMKLSDMTDENIRWCRTQVIDCYALRSISSHFFQMEYWNLGGWAAADGGIGVLSKDPSMRGGMQD
jgi:hypothetical protein